MKKYKQTPSQTIGPFFAHGLTPEQYRYNFTSIAHPVIADSAAKGEQIIIKGNVFDGDGNTVVDALLEFWQCDTKGKYSREEQNPNETGFKGFGRVGTGMNDQHLYEVKTIKPKGIKGEAPFINVTVFMRGMLNHQFTRIYFSDEKALNAKDSILNLVPKSRRNTLIAKRKEVGGLVIYHFDIHIQGKKETVFFDL
ncbi:MAG: protocatechuate 3,4-dioxygenase subunit alpha [Saprospiraceae bacterium]